MENWCYDKSTIDKIAIHYKTGKKLPDELYNKLKSSKTYQSGTGMMR